MNQRRVVCFINHTAETGGAEFALVRLLETLDRRVWEPVVVFGEDGPAVQILRDRSYECYVLTLATEVGKARRESLRGLRFGQCQAALGYVGTLWKFIRDRAVDVVHTNSMKAHVLGGLAARLARVPFVWHLRDSLHPACLPNQAVRVMRGLARTLPDSLITVSRSVAVDALGPQRFSRACVVYDGVDTALFEGDRPSPPSPELRQCWTVGIVGRLCPWKGQHVFLKAAENLVRKGVSVRFEILGGPLFGQESYEKTLREMARSVDLEGRVKFEGFVHDVPERIRQWDVLVHASTAPDPCPNVVIEAMASRVPVVGASSGGVPELLDNGRCGVLFEPGDAEGLSSGIHALLRNPSERVRLAGDAFSRARDLYRSERVAREVEQEWQRVCALRPRPHKRWPWIESGPDVLRAKKARGLASASRKTEVGGRLYHSRSL